MIIIGSVSNWLLFYFQLVKLRWLSKMARADWSRTSFSLAIITAIGDYSNNGFQFSKWRPDLLMFRSRKFLFLFYFLE